MQKRPSLTSLRRLGPLIGLRPDLVAGSDARPGRNSSSELSPSEASLICADQHTLGDLPRPERRARTPPAQAVGL